MIHASTIGFQTLVNPIIPFAKGEFVTNYKIGRFLTTEYIGWIKNHGELF